MRDREGRPDQPDEVPEEELDSERASELPDREALSVLGADVAIPLDPSIAADVLAGEPDASPEPDDADEGDSGADE